MATENVKVIKLDTQPAQTSVKELRQQLKELKNAMLSAEEGTQEYNDALQQAADIQHTLKEQMEEVNASAMDFGQITGNIVKATGGLVAGLQAAKATMNLFGVENEEVLKSLEKMQNLMAITQAIPALDDGIKAFKRLGLAIKSAAAATGTLGKALMGSGIGLAVAAVAALAANWDKVKVALGGVNNEYEDILQKRIDEYINRTITALSKQLDLQQKIISIRGGSDVDAATEAVKVYSSAIEEQSKKLDENKKRWEDWNRERGKQARMGNKDAVEQLDAALRGLDAEIKKQEALKENLELKKQEAEAELEVAKAVEKAKKEEEEKKYNKALAIEMDSAKAILGAEKSLQQQLDEKFEGKPLKVPVELEIEEDEDTSLEDELNKRIVSTIESLRGAFITPEDQYKQEIDALDLALKTKLIKEEEYLKLRDALNKEQTQNEVERYSVAANAIGGIFNSISEMMEEGSEEQKAFQIMGATINMLAGIATALAGAFTTKSGPWDIALAAIQAASIAASGGATISKMVNTNKNNAASMSKPSTSALASINAPVQYTQDVQGSQIEGAIKDSRVYVTETDITNTQRKVSVAESEARF